MGVLRVLALRLVLSHVCLLLVDCWESMLIKVLRSLQASIAVVRRSVGKALLRNELALGHLLCLTGLHLDTALLVAAAAVHSSVPPVLDGIVTATTKAAGDLCPTLAHLGDHLLNHLALFGGDRIVVKVGLEVLVVSLTALLGRAGTHHARDAHPVVSALRVNKAHEDVVLLLGPWTSLVCRHFEGSSRKEKINCLMR